MEKPTTWSDITRCFLQASARAGFFNPLIHYLWRQKIIDESNYLGIVQFGTETFHSTSNVTFSAQDFNFTIHQGKPASETSLSSGRFLPNLALLLLASALSLLVSV